MKTSIINTLDQAESQTFSQKHFFSLTYTEAIFYGLMVAASESYALYFAIQKGLSSLQIALLTTVPLLLGSLFQWIVPYYVKEKTLSLSILLSMFIQIIGLFGLWFSEWGTFSYFLVFISLSLYWMGGQAAQPLFIDWISQFFHPQDFSPFLSKRNSLAIFATLFFYVLLALLYEFYHISPFIIFFVGLFGRIISCSLQGILTWKTKNIPVQKMDLIEKNMIKSEIKKEKVDLVSQGVELSFQKFKKLLWFSIFLTGLFRFAVSLSSPFFLPYMVNVLKLDTWNFVLLTAVPMLGKALFLTGWSRVSSGLQPFIALQVTTFFIGLCPYLWTVSSNFSYLMSLEFINGIFWGGFDFACILIIQNLISKESRKLLGIHMAIMNALSVLGSYLGSLLLISANSYHSLFLLSTFSRVAVAIVFFFYFLRYTEIRFNISVYRVYIFTVLSLRPNVSQLLRVLHPRTKYLYHHKSLDLDQ